MAGVVVQYGNKGDSLRLYMEVVRLSGASEQQQATMTFTFAVRYQRLWYQPRDKQAQTQTR